MPPWVAGEFTLPQLLILANDGELPRGSRRGPLSPDDADRIAREYRGERRGPQSPPAFRSWAAEALGLQPKA